MAHEVEEAAFLPRALELFLPHLEHVLLAPDAVADGRHGAEAEERPVVVAPRRRQLHQLAVRRRVAVGQVAVHEVRVIDEAVLLEQAHGALRRIGRRHARAERTHVEDFLEDVERLQQELLFLLDAALQASAAAALAKASAAASSRRSPNATARAPLNASPAPVVSTTVTRRPATWVTPSWPIPRAPSSPSVTITVAAPRARSVDAAFSAPSRPSPPMPLKRAASPALGVR